jgi:hypothetical protein
MQVRVQNNYAEGVVLIRPPLLTFDELTAADQKTAAKAMPKGDQVAECTMSVTSGSGSAIVEWRGRNIDSNSDGHLIATFNITNTSSQASHGPGDTVPNFTYTYFECIAISGTGAVVTPTVGV